MNYLLEYKYINLNPYQNFKVWCNGRDFNMVSERPGFTSHWVHIKYKYITLDPHHNFKVLVKDTSMQIILFDTKQYI